MGVLLLVAVATIGVGFGLQRCGAGVAVAPDASHESTQPRDPAGAGGTAQAEVPATGGREPVPGVAEGCRVVGIVRCIGADPADVELRVVLMDDEGSGDEVVTRPVGDGGFSLPVPWRANRGVIVRVGGPGLTSRVRVFGSIVRDGVLDVGTVEVHAGAILTGTVRTESGRPLPGLSLRLDAVEPLEVDAFGAVGRNRVGLASDERGRLLASGAVRPGRWRVRREGTGLLAVSPEQFDVLGDAVDLQLVVREGASISGVVVGTDGLPAVGVQLEARPVRGAQRVSMLPCVSDANGAFVLRAQEGAELADAVCVHLIEGVDRGRTSIGEPVPIRWGTTGHVVTVQQTTAIELQVLDASTGRAIERFAVSCESDRSLVWRLDGPHVGGRVTVQPFGPGPWLLSVLPQSQERPVVLHRPVSRGQTAMLVEIDAAAAASIEVRSPAGPVEGASVVLLGTLDEQSPVEFGDARAVDLLGSLLAYVGGAARLGGATTDARGVATLRPPPDWPGARWLVVAAPERATRVQRFDAAGPNRVHFAPDATVSGRVAFGRSDTSILDFRVVLCVTEEGAGPVVSASAVLDEHGGFSLRGAPGSHELWLQRRSSRQGRRLRSQLVLASGQRLALGDLSPE